MDEFEPDGLDAVPVKAAEAAAALEALREPADRAARDIEDAFGRAAVSLSGSLARAARDGQVSLEDLARAVLAALNTVVGGRGGGSLGEAVVAALGGLFGGSRADGGPVSPGAAYLVGERGPEVFRPATAGTVEPVTAVPVTVNVTVEGGPEALLRSEAQLAQALTRAAALGRRGV